MGRASRTNTYRRGNSSRVVHIHMRLHFQHVLRSKPRLHLRLLLLAPPLVKSLQTSQRLALLRMRVSLEPLLLRRHSHLLGVKLRLGVFEVEGQGGCLMKTTMTMTAVSNAWSSEKIRSRSIRSVNSQMFLTCR